MVPMTAGSIRSTVACNHLEQERNSAADGRRLPPHRVCGLQMTALVTKTSWRSNPAWVSRRSKLRPLRSPLRGTPVRSAPRAPGASAISNNRARRLPFSAESTRRRPSIPGHFRQAAAAANKSRQRRACSDSPTIDWRPGRVGEQPPPRDLAKLSGGKRVATDRVPRKIKRFDASCKRGRRFLQGFDFSLRQECVASFAGQQTRRERDDRRRGRRNCGRRHEAAAAGVPTGSRDRDRRGKLVRR